MANYKKTHIHSRKLSNETQMMSYGYDPFMSEGAVKQPVFLTSTFAFKKAEDGEEFFDVASGRKAMPEGSAGGLIYSRINHPNLEIAEDRLALLENAQNCNIFASGMAAISATFLAFLKPGDVILHSSPLYGGTEVLIRKALKELNIISVEFENANDEAAIKASFEKASKLGRIGIVFIETPGNPTNSMVDFAKIKAATDAFKKLQNSDIVTICDNTLLGPIFQKPLVHGIDLTCYSLTKYVGGHSDLVAGAVMGRKELMDKVRTIRIAFGAHLDPHSAWMISRSLETLHLRMNRAQESALKIAAFIKENFKNVEVLHPKFIENSAYQALLAKQCEGFGSTFAFVIKGGRKESFKFINSLQIFKSAVSLGGSESLVCHPASTTHSGVEEVLREKLGIKEGLIRLSIGLENPDDLIADLQFAFANL
jgi:cystathionine beta-lyase/cystathionine gamma-synthase